MKFSPLSNPIMFVGDNPSLPGGLSRICRDLATLTATMPEFRVGVLGRGLGQRRKFPLTLYDFDESGGWGEGMIAPAWGDFAGSQPGVIMTLDDPSRRTWFGAPALFPPHLREFLGQGRNFAKWGYFPIDSIGPAATGPGFQGSLGIEGRLALGDYQRVLASSEWGRNILSNSGRADADWIPHGIFMDKFKPVEHSREILGWQDGQVWMGSVMANQSRKDFPVLMEAIAALRAHYGNRLRAWIHTDTLVRYWNIPALAQDFGVSDVIEVSMDLDDAALAVRYSGCDCTMLPSGGEGFGYPIAESLACGTPAIVTDYAAGQELVQAECRVTPMCFRIDTSHNVRRAVLSGYAFAQAAIHQIELKKQDWEYRGGELRQTVDHLGWDKLRHVWERWLREGLR